MQLKRTKTIHYIPGLVVALALLLLFYNFSCQYHKTQYGIPYYCIDPTAFTDYVLLPERNYLEIAVSGNDADDKISIGFARLKARQIISQKDTLNGIRFSFGDHCEYRKLIDVLDVLRTEKAIYYYYVANGDLWFFYQSPRKKDTSNEVELLYL